MIAYSNNMSMKDGWVATVRVSLSSSLTGPSALLNSVPLINFLMSAILYIFGTRHLPLSLLPLASSHVSGKDGQSKPKEDRTFLFAVNGKASQHTNISVQKGLQMQQPSQPRS